MAAAQVNDPGRGPGSRRHGGTTERGQTAGVGLYVRRHDVGYRHGLEHQPVSGAELPRCRRDHIRGHDAVVAASR